MILNGDEKSALLLLSIGTNQAGEILKHLTPFEVQKLISVMVNIKHVSKEKLYAILHECYDLAIKNSSCNYNSSDDYIVDMLTKALGEKKGHSLLEEAIEIRNAKICIKALNSMKSEELAVLLNNEHPQIITTILICLNQHQAAEILSFFSHEQRAEIILRITKFNSIEDVNLIELNKVVNNLLKNKKSILLEKGGIKTAANILNFMKITHEKETIKKINFIDEKIAKKIIQEMFLFENIVNLHDRYIKIVVQNLEKEKLYIALHNTSLTIREKFFKHMSEQDVNKLSLMLEKISYISDTSIKNEQKLIFIMIKNIIDNGNFLLKNIGDYYA